MNPLDPKPTGPQNEIIRAGKTMKLMCRIFGHKYQMPMFFDREISCVRCGRMGESIKSKEIYPMPKVKKSKITVAEKFDSSKSMISADDDWIIGLIESKLRLMKLIEKYDCNKQDLYCVIDNQYDSQMLVIIGGMQDCIRCAWYKAYFDTSEISRFFVCEYVPPWERQLYSHVIMFDKESARELIND